jgi:hypothetical protein
VRLWFGPAVGNGPPATVVGPLLRHNELVTDTWNDGDVQVLVCENQGTWMWGRASDGRYVERENLRGTHWTPTGEDEEQFWLHHAAVEALLAMPAARCGVLTDTTSLTRIEAFSYPVPCGTWRWPGCQEVRHRQAGVVTLARHDDGSVEVMAGAPSERELAWVDALGIDWGTFDSRQAQP